MEQLAISEIKISNEETVVYLNNGIQLGKLTYVEVSHGIDGVQEFVIKGHLG